MDVRARSGTGGKKRAQGQYVGGGVETSSSKVLLPAQPSSFQKYQGDESSINKGEYQEVHLGAVLNMCISQCSLWKRKMEANERC